MQLNLVFRKKLARIQAAGVKGFVKSAFEVSDKPAIPAMQ
jgi:hypothetical protein